MSLPEQKPYSLKGIELDVEVEDGTLFFTYCHDCKKVLYSATKDNDITRLVAREIMHDHGEFYDYRHRILVMKNPNRKGGKVISENNP